MAYAYRGLARLAQDRQDWRAVDTLYTRYLDIVGDGQDMFHPSTVAAHLALGQARCSLGDRDAGAAELVAAAAGAREMEPARPETLARVEAAAAAC